MKREGKGKSIGNYVSDYCVLDLETTGLSILRDKIIEISAIRVRNGKVVDTYSTLVNPKIEIPEEATEVNHITNEMVFNAPVLEEVLDEFIKFIGEDVIIGYNVSSFDLNMIYDAVAELKGEILHNNYIDLLHVVRCIEINIPDKRLETLSKFFGLDTTGEHRALKDCYLTHECYERFFLEYGENPFKRASSVNNGPRKKRRLKTETKALRELNALVSEIMCDGVISSDEFKELSLWMVSHQNLSGSYPFDKIFSSVCEILKDGIVSKEELDELEKILKESIDPVGCNNCVEQDETIQDKHVCITGDFCVGTREDVIKLVEEHGGKIDKSIKRATNILVVGSKGSELWKTEKYGTKIQRAMELQEKGFEIKIMKENDFISMIDNFSGIIENCIKTEDGEAYGKK